MQKILTQAECEKIRKMSEEEAEKFLSEFYKPTDEEQTELDSIYTRLNPIIDKLKNYNTFTIRNNVNSDCFKADSIKLLVSPSQPESITHKSYLYKQPMLYVYVSGYDKYLSLGEYAERLAHEKNTYYNKHEFSAHIQVSEFACDLSFTELEANSLAKLHLQYGDVCFTLKCEYNPNKMTDKQFSDFLHSQKYNKYKLINNINDDVIICNEVSMAQSIAGFEQLTYYHNKNHRRTFTNYAHSIGCTLNKFPLMSASEILADSKTGICTLIYGKVVFTLICQR